MRIAFITAMLASTTAMHPVAAAVESVHFESRSISFLGVRVAEVDSSAASRLRLPEQRGVLILAVAAKSPAKEGGLQAEDVLWTFRDEALHSVAQLRRLLRETPPGRRISLGFYRDGRLQSSTIALAANERHGEFHLDIPGFHLRFPRDLLELGPFGAIARPQLGISVVPLTEQLADHLGAKGGLLVTAVQDASAADKAGIRAGDVIQRVDRRSVDSAAELRDALGGKSEVVVQLVRDHKTRTVTVELAQSARIGPVI